jgi:hypothetical protein
MSVPIRRSEGEIIARLVRVIPLIAQSVSR